METQPSEETKSYSLAELLEKILIKPVCFDKINFNLDYFEIHKTEDEVNVILIDQLQRLAGHLASKTSHKSAVGLIVPKTQETDTGDCQESPIGHAISMYDFDVSTKTFRYKDPSAKAYDFFKSESPDAEPPSLLHLPKPYEALKEAWTFTAEYNVSN